MPGIDETTLLTIIVLVGIVSFAGLVHGTLGLGFAMMATPMVALLTDVRSAILITLAPTMAVNIASILRGGQWEASIGRFWPLAAYVSVGSVLGTGLLIIAEPGLFKLLLAGMIAAYLNLDRLRGVRMRWIRNRPRLAHAAFGLAGGFMAGTTNVMVPVLIVFALELSLATTVTVQVFNLCFLSGKLSQAVTFGYAGTLTTQALLATTPLAVVAIIALLLGNRLRDRIDTETYRGWLKKVLLIMASVLVVQFLLDTWPALLG